MKALLWIAAVLIALVLLLSWKLLRREPRVLRGRVSPVLLRMAVMLLIVAGLGDEARSQTRPGFGGDDESHARPLQLTVKGRQLSAPIDAAPLNADFAGELDDASLRNWATLNGEHNALALLLQQLQHAEAQTKDHALKALAQYASDKPVRRQLVLPPAFRAVIAAELPDTPVDAKDAGRSLSNLINAADQLAADGFISGSLIAYLWRTAPATVDPVEAPTLAELYARLESQARMNDALRLAQAETGPVKYVPWMSKAARPEGDTTRIIIPPGLATVAKRVYATTPAGTWETDAVFSFKLQDGARLYRRGQKIELKAGEFVRLRRFDVLVSASATAEHRLLGDLKLPPVLTSRSLAGHVSPEADARISGWIVAALEGDPDALKLLEITLPAAYRSIDKAISDPANANAKGTPPLRLLQTLYDE